MVFFEQTILNAQEPLCFIEERPMAVGKNWSVLRMIIDIFNSEQRCKNSSQKTEDAGEYKFVPPTPGPEMLRKKTFQGNHMR